MLGAAEDDWILGEVPRCLPDEADSTRFNFSPAGFALWVALFHLGLTAAVVTIAIPTLDYRAVETARDRGDVSVERFHPEFVPGDPAGAGRSDGADGRTAWTLFRVSATETAPGKPGPVESRGCQESDCHETTSLRWQAPPRAPVPRAKSAKCCSSSSGFESFSPDPHRDRTPLHLTIFASTVSA